MKRNCLRGKKGFCNLSYIKIFSCPLCQFTENNLKMKVEVRRLRYQGPWGQQEGQDKKILTVFCADESWPKSLRMVCTNCSLVVLFSVFIVIIVFIVLHGLFLSSKVLKLPRFWIPHAFDLHLEFCHLDAKKLLLTKKWSNIW